MRRTKIDVFVSNIIAENGWSRTTDWGGRELKNTNEAASLRDNMQMHTDTLKKLIRAHAMFIA